MYDPPTTQLAPSIPFAEGFNDTLDWKFKFNWGLLHLNLNTYNYMFFNLAKLSRPLYNWWIDDETKRNVTAFISFYLWCPWTESNRIWMSADVTDWNYVGFASINVLFMTCLQDGVEMKTRVFKNT